MDHLKELDSLSECQLCVTPFAYTEPLRLPTRGKHCLHRICQLCIFHNHILLSNRRRYLACPACLSPSSFHARRPMVDKELCQALQVAPTLVRRELLKVHRQPWDLPLGAYATLLERIGNWRGSDYGNRDMALSTMHGLVQGLMQVHRVEFRENRYPPVVSEEL